MAAFAAVVLAAVLLIVGVIVLVGVISDRDRAEAKPAGPPHMPGVQSECTEHGDRIYWREGWPEPFGVVGGGCRG